MALQIIENNGDYNVIGELNSSNLQLLKMHFKILERSTKQTILNNIDTEEIKSNDKSVLANYRNFSVSGVGIKIIHRDNILQPVA